MTVMIIIDPNNDNNNNKRKLQALPAVSGLSSFVKSLISKNNTKITNATKTYAKVEPMPTTRPIV